MEKISILIPTYKPGTYIERCLESIERQDFPKEYYKVYVALNGPREDYEGYLREVLSRFSFSSELFYLEQAGVSNARNFLIDKSVEEFVVFVDDDDVLSENYLEELLQASSHDILGITNSYNFFESLENLKENFVGKCFKNLDGTTSSKFKSRKYFSSPCAKMIHRKIIGKVRFDTKLAIGEDSLFMAQLSHRVKAVKKTSDTTSYYVYEREGSATRQRVNKKKELQRIIYLLKEYSKMLLSFRYDTLFIMTRIAATLLHGRNLFK